MDKSYVLGSKTYLKGIRPSIKPLAVEESAQLTIGDFVELGFIEECQSGTIVEFLFIKIEVIFPDKYIGAVNTDVKKLRNVYFGERISFSKDDIISIFWGKVEKKVLDNRLFITKEYYMLRGELNEVC